MYSFLLVEVCIGGSQGCILYCGIYCDTVNNPLVFVSEFPYYRGKRPTVNLIEIFILLKHLMHAQFLS